MNNYWHFILQKVFHKDNPSYAIQFTHVYKQRSGPYEAVQAANPKKNKKNHLRYCLDQLGENIYLTHKETIVVLSGTSQTGKKSC